VAKVPASACFMTWSVLSVTQFLPTGADQTARRVVGDQFAQRNFAGGRADKLRQVGGNGEVKIKFPALDRVRNDQPGQRFGYRPDFYRRGGSAEQQQRDQSEGRRQKNECPIETLVHYDLHLVGVSDLAIARACGEHKGYPCARMLIFGALLDCLEHLSLHQKVDGFEGRKQPARPDYFCRHSRAPILFVRGRSNDKLPDYLLPLPWAPWPWRQASRAPAGQLHGQKQRSARSQPSDHNWTGRLAIMTAGSGIPFRAR
jgi:hypothetical protein